MPGRFHPPLFIVVLATAVWLRPFPAAAGPPAAGGTGASPAITTVELAHPGRAEQREVPVTFGQVFKPGDLPKGRGLAARGPDGSPLPLQLDAKASHRDGSLRHGVVTLRLPKLPPGRPVRVDLLAAPAARSEGAAVDGLPAENWDAEVVLTLGGQTYTAAARPLLQAARKGGTLKNWLNGPLVSEWTVAAPFRKADGSVHPHLAARFDVRAYAGLKPVRTDIAIENDWAYEPNPSGFVYDVAIRSGGQTVYERKGVQHTHHARWHRIVWWGGEPRVDIRQDVGYLIATRAIPYYDRSIAIHPKALENLPAEYEPMDNGGLRSGMPDGGAHSDIGPLPNFAVIYLLTMNPAARANTLANGGAGGAFQIHYRDRKTDRPLSIDDYPYAGLRGNPPDKVNPRTGQSEAFPEVTNGLERHVPDDAHQPSVAYLPYLISGDRFQLEELHFWASFNLLFVNPGYRRHEQGIFGYGQVRAIAWNLRTLADAAYITPDADPMKRHFEEKLRNNIAVFNQAFPGDTGYSGLANRLGAWNWSGFDGFTRPWMDDFVTWSFGHLVDLGYEEARPTLMYKTTFVVGRMTPPFHWQHASMYQSIGKDAAGRWFTDFGAYYRANFQDAPTGTVMDGYPESPYGYGANMQPALATAVDAGAPGAAEAWKRYETRVPRQAYEQAPVWAIVPRGTPFRLPAPMKPAAGLPLAPFPLPSTRPALLPPAAAPAAKPAPGPAPQPAVRAKSSRSPASGRVAGTPAAAPAADAARPPSEPPAATPQAPAAAANPTDTRSATARELWRRFQTNAKHLPHEAPVIPGISPGR